MTILLLINVLFSLLFLLFILYFLVFLALLYAQKRQHAHIQNALTSLLLHLPLFRSTLYGIRATAHRQQGQYRLAIQDLDSILTRHSRYAWAYYERGQNYAVLKEHARAIEDFSAALEHNPRLARAYHARGVVYNRVKEEQSALHDFNDALSLDPRSTTTYFYRALLYLRQREYAYALQDIDTLARIAPDDSHAYEYQGIFYSHLKDFERALSCFDYAVQLNPGYASAYHSRALAHMALHDFSQAQSDLHHALSLDTLNLLFHYSFVALQICLEMPSLDTEALAERLEKIATHNSAPELSLLCCGIALYLRQRPEEALATLQQALILDPGNTNIHLWLAIVCASLLRDQEARMALDTALDSNLPPVLFLPLRLVEPLNPDFYQQEVLPVLTSIPPLPSPSTD